MTDLQAPDGYAATVRAMDDSTYRQEVTDVTAMAARSTRYCRWDAMAQVLADDRPLRPGGAELYARGHDDMVRHCRGGRS